MTVSCIISREGSPAPHDQNPDRWANPGILPQRRRLYDMAVAVEHYEFPAASHSGDAARIKMRSVHSPPASSIRPPRVPRIHTRVSPTWVRWGSARRCFTRPRSPRAFPAARFRTSPMRWRGPKTTKLPSSATWRRSGCSLGRSRHCGIGISRSKNYSGLHIFRQPVPSLSGRGSSKAAAPWFVPEGPCRSDAARKFGDYRYHVPLTGTRCAGGPWSENGPFAANVSPQI
jgi:hypothetical protein